MAVKAKVRRVIAEEQPGGFWLVMLEDGSVEEHQTHNQVERAIRARDARAAKRAGIVVTEIEWRPIA